MKRISPHWEYFPNLPFQNLLLSLRTLANRATLSAFKCCFLPLLCWEGMENSKKNICIIFQLYMCFLKAPFGFSPFSLYSVKKKKKANKIKYFGKHTVAKCYLRQSSKQKLLTSKRIWGETHQIEVALVSIVGSLGLQSVSESITEKKKILALVCSPILFP